MTELCIVEAPLDLEQLIQVGKLYGIIDQKYANIDYCTNLFNKNPAGPSLHAFVHIDSRPVGHYCLIPMDVRIGRRVFATAKAEALYVVENFRSTLIDLHGRAQPVAVAMSNALYKRAFEKGIEFIHLNCQVRLGAFHKLLGFKEYLLRDVNHYFFIRRGHDLKHKYGVLYVIMIFIHSIIFQLARIFCLMFTPHGSRATDSSSKLNDDTKTGIWNVVTKSGFDDRDKSMGIATIQGRKEFASAKVFLPSTPNCFAEIVSWPQERNSIFTELDLVVKVLQAAKKSAAIGVRFSFEFLGMPRHLRMLSRFLLFPQISRTIPFYVLYNSHCESLEPVAIDPLFYSGY